MAYYSQYSLQTPVGQIYQCLVLPLVFVRCAHFSITRDTKYKRQLFLMQAIHIYAKLADLT